MALKVRIIMNPVITTNIHGNIKIIAHKHSLDHHLWHVDLDQPCHIIRGVFFEPLTLSLVTTNLLNRMLPLTQHDCVKLLTN